MMPDPIVSDIAHSFEFVFTPFINWLAGAATAVSLIFAVVLAMALMVARIRSRV